MCEDSMELEQSCGDKVDEERTRWSMAVLTGSGLE